MEHDFTPYSIFSLVVVVFDELDDNLLLRLNLQHLQDETQELGGLLVASKRAAQVCKRHRLIDQSLRSQPEAVLLPVAASDHKKKTANRTCSTVRLGPLPCARVIRTRQWRVQARATLTQSEQAKNKRIIGEHHT